MALAAELDLSLSQIRALLLLWREVAELLSLGERADGVGLSDAAAAVRMVDGLLRGDLVVRREDERDRRVKRITLSAAGQLRLRAAFVDANWESFAQLVAEELDAR